MTVVRAFGVTDAGRHGSGGLEAAPHAPVCYIATPSASAAPAWSRAFFFLEQQTRQKMSTSIEGTHKIAGMPKRVSTAAPPTTARYVGMSTHWKAKRKPSLTTITTTIKATHKIVRIAARMPRMSTASAPTNGRVIQ